MFTYSSAGSISLSLSLFKMKFIFINGFFFMSASCSFNSASFFLLIEKKEIKYIDFFIKIKLSYSFTYFN
jgi:hypothetical protein